MKCFSTSGNSPAVSVSDAIMAGLAPDGDLYLPESIAPLSAEILGNLGKYSLQEIGYVLASQLVGDEIPSEALRGIVEQTLNFPVPIVRLTDDLTILELFHGPTGAFKDFGARFMAGMLSYLRRGNSKPLTILVATSGDTGGAVAAGFHRVPGIRVVILYPAGRVSPLQEQQLTTWGDNITALEVEGSFDDCQRMVKEAFRSEDLKARYELSSANSINLARLIPQSFYYGFAVCELARETGKVPEDLTVVIPSGNFGNLTAAVLAQRLGFPIRSLIAATNANATVPEFLAGDDYTPRSSVHTLSNAMDVGDPSNFARLLALFDGEVSELRKAILGLAVSDDDTEGTIRRVENETRYILDPHSAVGVYAANQLVPKGKPVIVAATAHPAKFHEVVEPVIGRSVPMPEVLGRYLERKKKSKKINASLKSLAAALDEL